MNETLIQYSVVCTGAGNHGTVTTNFIPESLGAPTVCPTDTSDTIDSAKTSIINVREPALVSIKEELTNPTGGNAKIWGYSFTAAASTTTDFLLSWPFPITLLAGTLYCPAQSDDDIIELTVAPDTVIGAITVDVSISDITINVQQSVTDNVDVGYFVNLYNGVTTVDLGRVLSVDKENNTITVENAATSALLALTPTYVRMSVKVVENIQVTSGAIYDFGKKKQGGKHIPANTNLRVSYTETNATSKTVRFHIEGIY